MEWKNEKGYMDVKFAWVSGFKTSTILGTENLLKYLWNKVNLAINLINEEINLVGDHWKGADLC